jgi:hypothetical protein
MVMRRTGRSLAELTAGACPHPQRMISIKTTRRIDWLARPDIIRARATESQLAGNGRVLLRPSGTEPVLRVVEAQDATVADRQARRLAEVVNDRLNAIRQQLIDGAAGPRQTARFDCPPAEEAQQDSGGGTGRPQWAGRCAQSGRSAQCAGLLFPRAMRAARSRATAASSLQD